MGPDRELRIAMLAEDKGVDALGTDIERLRQGTTQTGGIQPDAGADHLITRQAGELPHLPGDDVARVGGNQKDAVKAARHHLRNNILHNAGRGVQLIQPRLARFERAAGDGDHRDIHIGTVARLAGGDAHHAGHIGGSIRQVPGVAFTARLVDIHQQQLFADILVQQGVGSGGSGVSGPDNHHFTGFGVHCFPEMLTVTVPKLTPQSRGAQWSGAAIS